MPTPSGVITANEFSSAFKMSREETIYFVNSKIKQAMNKVVLAKGFFTIRIMPEFDVDLMISLLSEAGFEVSHYRSRGFFQESNDILKVEIPIAPKD